MKTSIPDSQRWPRKYGGLEFRATDAGCVEGADDDMVTFLGLDTSRRRRISSGMQTAGRRLSDFSNSLTSDTRSTGVTRRGSLN